jgi:hypothetical protein
MGNLKMISPSEALPASTTTNGSGNTSAPVVEKFLTMPIRNPETGRPTQAFMFIGVLDNVADGCIVRDWKTTDDIPKYIDRTKLGFQADSQALLALANGINVTGVQYCLIQRPRIKLKKNQTPAEYEDECVQWIADQPMGVYEHELYFNTARLENAQWRIYHVAKQIADNRITGRWLMNSGACHSYGRRCEYASLCIAEVESVDTEQIIREEYRPRTRRHEDEDGLDFGGKDALSYSGCECFTTCQKKYAWKYEREIEPDTEDTSEALRVGKLMHLGIEALIKGGMAEAVSAIERKAAEIPFLGEDGHKTILQEAAKARAMVRIAAMQWKL